MELQPTIDWFQDGTKGVHQTSTTKTEINSLLNKKVKIKHKLSESKEIGFFVTRYSLWVKPIDISSDFKCFKFHLKKSLFGFQFSLVDVQIFEETSHSTRSPAAGKLVGHRRKLPLSAICWSHDLCESPARHWLATADSSSRSSIGWLLKPLSTLASDWTETNEQDEMK